VLRILRGKLAELQVDAYHRTLTQVELPFWLPLDIVEQVTVRFEDILRDQITIMMACLKKEYARHPSNQSAGDCSSDKDDESDCDYDSDDAESRAFDFE
jgi:hypothetical protein